MPVERILALTPGTLLALEDRAEDGVQLFAEGVPIGRARPGLRGARRALKLNAPIEPGPALTMHACDNRKDGRGTRPAAAYGQCRPTRLRARGREQIRRRGRRERLVLASAMA